jgi:hypothetical protein
MRLTFRRIAVTFALLAAPAGSAPAAGQFIGIKSVPVATGDQFLVHPSRNFSMGGVSIAIDDPLLDPFVNPAKGSRMRDSHFYGAPVFYTVSDGDGSGRTLPVGALFASETWFGGVQLSLQQIDAADRTNGIIFIDQPVPFSGPFPQPRRLRDKAANNLYASGLVGRRIPGTRLSVGASALYADLEALDGVDLLYTLSESIQQSGHVADLRAGVTAEMDGGATFEGVLLHHRIDMTHEITNVSWGCCFGPVRQDETNYDRTNTWGVHLGYRRPVGRQGWSAGGILTTNRKTHPKIPNYEIMNIPRDPGDSWAWNFGIGLARENGPTTFAVDLIWEPISSNTWAEADSLIQSPLGHQIRRGEKTIENDFSFSNAILRTGLLHETARWGASLGLDVHTYSYDLAQTDNFLRTNRDQHESWMEWSPTWGASFRLSGLELRYSGRLTTGSGRPGVEWSPTFQAELLAMSDFIIAPSAPLTLQDAHIVTHQLSVSLPIR